MKKNKIFENLMKICSVFRKIKKKMYVSLVHLKGNNSITALSIRWKFGSLVDQLFASVCYNSRNN